MKHLDTLSDFEKYPLLYALIFFILLIGVGILLWFYLEGHFTYDEEIISRKRYTKSIQRMDLYGGDYITKREVEIVLIQRTYVSGKITFKTKEYTV